MNKTNSDRADANSGFPEPPWKLRGRMCAGLVRGRTFAPLPEGLEPLFGGEMIMVMAIRYLGRDVAYNEFIIGVPTLRGRKPGLFISGIWVDSEESREGGRAIWALPKEMAHFEWDSNGVEIATENGPLASVRFESGRLSFPARSWPLPFFGSRNGNPVYTVGSLRGRVRGASVQTELHDSSLAELLEPSSRGGVESPAFELVLPPPAKQDA